jgi:hypothetical protein
MKIDGVDKKVAIEQIQCGKGHSIALLILNIRYVMEWNGEIISMDNWEIR